MNIKNFLFRLCALTAVIALMFSAALAASEVLDLTFGESGIVTADFGSDADTGNMVILQPDGKIYMLGFAPANPETPSLRPSFITRYYNNGVIDTSFGVNGTLTPAVSGFSTRKIAVQPDGSVILAGQSLYGYGFAFVRYDASGVLDTSFGDNGTTAFDLYGDTYENLADVVIQPDGKIVAVGEHAIFGSNFIDFYATRITANGTPDTSFVANGLLIMDKTDFPNNRYNYGKAAAIQPDGKIVLSGHMMDDNGETQISLARLNPDGSFDKSAFGTNGHGTVMTPLAGFRHSSGAIALQADGKIIVAGTIYDEENNIKKDFALVRFNKDGSLDVTFGGTGIVVTDFGGNEYGADIHLQADGKIVMVGTTSSGDSTALLIARYNSDGALDSSFGDNGILIGDAVTSCTGVEIQPDGKIIVVGSNSGNAFLARYGAPIVTKSVTFKSVGAYDGWILEYAENSNTGGSMDKLATTFNVGDALRDRQYRGILSFNSAALPDNAIVTSAQLKIKRQGLVGIDPFTTHGGLYFNISNKAFSNNLALQLTDFNAAFSAGSTQDPITADTLGWYAASLSQTNLNFISKVGLTQFRLFFEKDDNDDLNADYLKFFSGNSTSANMPQLIINYYVP